MGSVVPTNVSILPPLDCSQSQKFMSCAVQNASLPYPSLKFQIYGFLLSFMVQFSAKNLRSSERELSFWYKADRNSQSVHRCTEITG